MTACPWCGTNYETFRPKCRNCGASLPLPPKPTGEPGLDLPAPPPAPRDVPRGYLWRRLLTDAGSIVGGVLAIIGGVFMPLGLALLLPSETRVVGLVFTLVGLPLLGAGAGLLAWRYRGARQRVDVLRLGVPVLGEISDVYENVSVMVNGRFPWTIAYRFRVDGREHEGQVTSLRQPGEQQQPGKPVYVLYLAGSPEKNAIYPGTV